MSLKTTVLIKVKSRLKGHIVHDSTYKRYQEQRKFIENRIVINRIWEKKRD